MTKIINSVLLSLICVSPIYSAPLIEPLDEVSVLKIIKKDTVKLEDTIKKMNNKSLYINYINNDNIKNEYNNLLKIELTDYIRKYFKNIELKNSSIDYDINRNKYTGEIYNDAKLADYIFNVELTNIYIEKKIKGKKNYYTSTIVVNLNVFNSNTDKYVDEIILSASSNTTTKFNIDEDDVTELISYGVRNVFLENQKIVKTILKTFYPAQVIYTLSNKKYVMLKIEAENALSNVNLNDKVVVYKYNEYEPSKIEKLVDGHVYQIGKENEIYIVTVKPIDNLINNNYIVEIK